MSDLWKSRSSQIGGVALEPADQEKPLLKCVFYNEEDCPILLAMKNHSVIDAMSPVKNGMQDKLIQSMGVSFGQITSFKFQSLAMFCALCFIKHKNDTIRDRKLLKETGPRLQIKTINDRPRPGYEV